MAKFKYWVLPEGGYPTDREDYFRVQNKRECEYYGLTDLGYIDNPGAQVFIADGSNPWESEDPHPDWYLSRGPRGGIVWERA